MTLVVEDGSGVAGANSLIALDDAQAYMTERGLTVTLTDGLMLRAMDSMLTFAFKGTKTHTANALPFPRTGLTDIDSNAIGNNVVPDPAKYAQVWLAYYIEQGSDPAAIPERPVKKEKIDVIEVEYFGDNSEATAAINALTLPNVRNLLLPYLLTSAVTVAGVASGFIGRA